MKALTAAIALMSLGTVIAPVPPAREDRVEPAPTIAPATYSEADPPSMLTFRPWDADYPHAQAIDGAQVYASDLEQVDDIAWAIEQLLAAGLALPTVEVWAHDDASGCRLDADDDTPPVGVYFQRNGVDTIFWCGTRFTMLHELAHVHDNNFLTDDQRDHFIAIRDVDAWRHDKWNRAAGEHFADVVAWGLHDRTVRPSRTFPNDNASLDAAFELAISFSR